MSSTHSPSFVGTFYMFGDGRGRSRSLCSNLPLDFQRSQLMDYGQGECHLEVTAILSSPAAGWPAWQGKLEKSRFVAQGYSLAQIARPKFMWPLTGNSADARADQSHEDDGECGEHFVVLLWLGRKRTGAKCQVLRGVWSGVRRLVVSAAPGYDRRGAGCQAGLIRAPTPGDTRDEESEKGGEIRVAERVGGRGASTGTPARRDGIITVIKEAEF
ncbi:hypothetical protein Bbelb_140090 [Branchiostoma belcheri]|nr:hypothetical protein Bbelb_140090 [Branchiostoma belcheri]